MRHEPMTDAELAELERVYGASTQGEWSLDPHYQCYIWGPNSAMIADDGGGWPANEKEYLTRMRGVGANLPLAENGEAIAALHNAFPRLLATISQERERCAQVAEGTWSPESNTLGEEYVLRHQIAAKIRSGK